MSPQIIALPPRRNREQATRDYNETLLDILESATTARRALKGLPSLPSARESLPALENSRAEVVALRTAPSPAIVPNQPDLGRYSLAERERLTHHAAAFWGMEIVVVGPAAGAGA